MNLVLHFLYIFGPFAYNLCDTKQASQLAVDGPVHQLSILLSSVGKAKIVKEMLKIMKKERELELMMAILRHRLQILNQKMTKMTIVISLSWNEAWIKIISHKNSDKLAFPICPRKAMPF